MTDRKRRPIFRTEQVAYWFFRLNGCMNIVNFLVHHERRGREGTDVDILAVRFPHRQELAMSNEPMRDHPVFDSDSRIDLIIAEVKTGRCRLNGPWIDPDKQNMHRVLYAVGAFPEDRVPAVAESLYECQFYTDDHFRVRLFALGREKDPDLYPLVVQLTWEDMLTFIYQRLKKYHSIKSQHRQWDWCGKRLYSKMRKHYRSSAEDFAQDVLAQMEG